MKREATQRCNRVLGDELPEFNRDVLEVMRQPLEDGHVTIARAAAALTYPARFTLVAAMNPCPCGFYGDPVKACTCSQSAVHKYLQKISGPLLDRIDLHIEVPRLKTEELSTPPNGENSAAIRSRVLAARDKQLKRFAAETATAETDQPTEKVGVSAPLKTFCNAHMTSRQLRTHCVMEPEAKALLSAAITTMHLSARAYDRILKVGRTIADLAGSDTIGVAHIAEAVQYRALDRKLWG